MLRTTSPMMAALWRVLAAGVGLGGLAITPMGFAQDTPSPGVVGTLSGADAAFDAETPLIQAAMCWSVTGELAAGASVFSPTDTQALRALTRFWSDEIDARLEDGPALASTTWASKTGAAKVDQRLAQFANANLRERELLNLLQVCEAQRAQTESAS